MFGSQPGKGNAQVVLGYLSYQIQELSKSFETTSEGGDVGKHGTV